MKRVFTDKETSTTASTVVGYYTAVAYTKLKRTTKQYRLFVTFHIGLIVL